MKPKPSIAEIASLTDTINKTGFVLEHKVASILENHGWSVIHNRYYLDDLEGGQREMDILAYKSTMTSDDVRLYTALIISCKKSVEHSWAFLTRKAPGMNINLNLLPVNFYSNQLDFNFIFNRLTTSKESFVKEYDDNNFIVDLYNYDNVVFAFQQIKKTTNAPDNDKPIFDSIITLLKSEAHEADSIISRTNKKHVYNLNLLTVADLNFHELNFVNEDISHRPIDRINYMNRFIINKKERHAKIEFVTLSKFEQIISDYNSLHDWNRKFYETIIGEFYANVFKKREYCDFILTYAKSEFLKFLQDRLDNYHEYQKLTYVFFELQDGVVGINVSDEDIVNAKLNQDVRTQSFTADWLEEHFRYKGSFRFVEWPLPF